MAEKLRSAEQDTARSEVNKKSITLSVTTPTLKEVMETLTNKKIMSEAKTLIPNRLTRGTGIESCIWKPKIQAMINVLTSQIELALSQSNKKDMLEFLEQDMRRGGADDYESQRSRSDIAFSNLKKIGENKYSIDIFLQHASGDPRVDIHEAYKYTDCYHAVQFTINNDNTLTITAFYKNPRQFREQRFY